MWMLTAIALAGAPVELDVPQPGQILAMAGHAIQWIPEDSALRSFLGYEARHGESNALPPEYWDDVGAHPDALWVLPADGSPAVQAEIIHVGFSEPGECGGYYGLLVVVTGPPAIAAVIGDPPDSWHHARVGPDLEVSRRLDAFLVDTHTEHLTERSRWVSYGVWGDVAHVRVTDVLHIEGEPGTFGYPTLQTDLRIDADGIHEVARRTYHQYAATPMVALIRDVDGDGVPDIVETGCATRIYNTETGLSIREPQGTCCGC